MGFDKSLISEIKARADIVEVIGDYINVNKKGKNYAALCPFHDDHNPSLTISREKQYYKCYSCGAGGDVYTFLTEYKSLTFPEAVKTVAQKYGIPVQDDDKNAYRYYDTFLTIKDINRDAAEVYHKYLFEHQNALECRNYLKSRKFTREQIIKYKLGYAPNYWHFASNILTSVFSHKPADVIKSGILGQSKKNGRWFDFFRNRLIIPIQNEKNEFIGFGGRALDDHGPKYLNTGETPVFKKSSLLYGLNYIIHQFAKSQEVYVTEGYFDVIACQTAGIPAVAPLGTALTEEQIIKLKRYASKMILLFDGDSAGQRAALKSSRLLAVNTIDGFVVILPAGQDPFDLFTKNGKEHGINYIKKNQQSIYDFLLDSLIQGQTPTPAEISRLSEEIGNLIAEFKNDVAREAFRKNAAQRLGVRPENLSAKHRRPLRHHHTIRQPYISTTRLKIERNYVILLANNPSYIKTSSAIIRPSHFKDPGSKYIYEKLLTIRHEKAFKKTDVIDLFAHGEKARDFIVKESLSELLNVNCQKQLEDYTKKMKLYQIQDELTEINQRISDASARGDEKNFHEYLRIKQEKKIEEQRLKKK